MPGLQPECQGRRSSSSVDAVSGCPTPVLYLERRGLGKVAPAQLPGPGMSTGKADTTQPALDWSQVVVTHSLKKLLATTLSHYL